MSKERPSIYQALQIEAVFDILNQSDMYFFRKICRWYSEKFHTPLHQVVSGEVVSWDDILLHYYEYQMDQIGYNKVFDMAVQEYVPELAEEYEEENQAFADALVEEQKRTLERKKKKDTKVSQKPQKSPEKGNKVSQKPPGPIRMNFDDEDIE